MELIERMDPFVNKHDLMYPEHYIRYMFAAQFIKNKTVLDCSCGNGYGSYYLANHGAKLVKGIDISEEAIAFSSKHFKKENLQFSVGDATNLSFIEDNSIDSYICFETIEHISDVKNMIKEIKRVLKFDGTLIISCPNDNIFNPENPYHLNKYTKESFVRLLSQQFKHSSLWLQNNISGSSIYKSEQLIQADIDQGPVSTLCLPITPKEDEQADTWLLVCSNSESDINEMLYPMCSFFTTYSQYIIEVQKTIDSLYNENKKLATGWEKQLLHIESLETENRRMSVAWEKQLNLIKELEGENEKLANAWKIQAEHINKVESENEKLAHAWSQHSELINNLENENRLLAQGWQAQKQYIDEILSIMNKKDEETKTLVDALDNKDKELLILSSAWNEHTQYIQRLEQENQKLATAWEIHNEYIKQIEEELKRYRGEEK